MIPFCCWLLIPVAPFLQKWSWVGIKGPSGNVKFERCETDIFLLPPLPPFLLQTGDYREAYGRPDGSRDMLASFKMKEGKTRRLTCNISKNLQALGSWTWISGQSNFFKDANCSQTQKTVGLCLSFHQGCKLLIRLHCWAGHFVYQ